MTTDPRDPGPEQEEEAHLHTELEHELARLARHPREEVHRLRDEAAAGENPATIGILLSGIGLWLTIAVVVVVTASFLIAYFVTR